MKAKRQHIVLSVIEMIMGLMLSASTPTDTFYITDADAWGATFSVKIGVNASDHYLSQLPVPLKQGTPDYPMELRLHTVAGYSIVKVTVERNGSVKSVEIVEGSQNLFSQAARAAALQWIYRPFDAKEPSSEIIIHYKVEFNIEMEMTAPTLLRRPR